MDSDLYEGYDGPDPPIMAWQDPETGSGSPGQFQITMDPSLEEVTYDVVCKPRHKWPGTTRLKRISKKLSKPFRTISRGSTQRLSVTSVPDTFARMFQQRQESHDSDDDETWSDFDDYENGPDAPHIAPPTQGVMSGRADSFSSVHNAGAPPPVVPPRERLAPTTPARLTNNRPPVPPYNYHQPQAPPPGPAIPEGRYPGAAQQRPPAGMPGRHRALAPDPEEEYVEPSTNQPPGPSSRTPSHTRPGGQLAIPVPPPTIPGPHMRDMSASGLPSLQDDDTYVDPSNPNEEYLETTGAGQEEEDEDEDYQEPSAQGIGPIQPRSFRPSPPPPPQDDYIDKPRTWLPPRGGRAPAPAPTPVPTSSGAGEGEVYEDVDDMAPKSPMPPSHRTPIVPKGHPPRITPSVPTGPTLRVVPSVHTGPTSGTTSILRQWEKKTPTTREPALPPFPGEKAPRRPVQPPISYKPPLAPDDQDTYEEPNADVESDSYEDPNEMAHRPESRRLPPGPKKTKPLPKPNIQSEIVQEAYEDPVTLDGPNHMSRTASVRPLPKLPSEEDAPGDVYEDPNEEPSREPSRPVSEEDGEDYEIPTETQSNLPRHPLPARQPISPPPPTLVVPKKPVHIGNLEINSMALRDHKTKLRPGLSGIIGKDSNNNKGVGLGQLRSPAGPSPLVSNEANDGGENSDSGTATSVKDLMRRLEKQNQSSTRPNASVPPAVAKKKPQLPDKNVLGVGNNNPTVTDRGSSSSSSSAAAAAAAAAAPQKVAEKASPALPPPILSPGVSPLRPVPLPPTPNESKRPTQGLRKTEPLPIPSNELDESVSWYFGDIPRVNADAKISALSMNGAFLVRRSTRNDPGIPYVLTLWYNTRTWNLHIRKKENRRFAVGSEKSDELDFPSVQELVAHHRINVITLAADSRRHQEGGKICLRNSPAKT